MAEWLISLISVFVGAVIGIFGNMWYGNYQDKRRRQIEGLKNHFIDLETNVIRKIIESLENTYNNQGYIYVTRQAAEETGYTTDIRQPHSYWPMRELESGKFIEFQFHFPNQAHEIIELKNSAYKHNESLDSFDKKLEQLIKEKVGGTCEIYNAAPRIIRYILNEIVKAKSEEDEEINEIKDRLRFEVSPPIYEKGNTLWRVGSSMGLYAQTSNEEEAISLKNQISELIESSSLLEQIEKILVEANKIVNAATGNVSILNIITEKYSKYSKSLKQKKDCTTCKLIFD